MSALVGLNTDLRREYIADCQAGVNRWNKILARGRASPHRLALPHVAFNRQVGAFAGIEAEPGRRASSARTSGSGATASGCPPTSTRLTSGR